MEYHSEPDPQEVMYRIEKEEKWFGVPPAGEKPAPSTGRIMIEILIVLAIEFFIWGIYRAVTAPIYGEGFNYPFFFGHIIFAPLIHLGPILIWWKFIRKERIFNKSDWEGNRHNSFSIGPFKMTRKFIFTAVLVGLLGGIIWRVTEMIVYDTSLVAMGGFEPMSLTLFDLFSGGDFALFLLMTFVMFCIVGPVEEFEFRSFVHDQSARVLPLWAALAFSSITFGLSHVPIALFVYKLTFVELVVAEIGWMTAGVTFGALYMWSRNIFACIVMHGIGNWQLSVFMLRSSVSAEGVTVPMDHYGTIIESIIANGAMILIFYLIHRFYWQPQRRGEAAFGGKLLKLQNRFFRHDSGQKSLFSTWSTLIVFTLLLLPVIIGVAAIAGTEPPEPKAMESTGQIDLQDYEVITEEVRLTYTLSEGGEETLSFNSSISRIIKNVTLSLTWDDESTPPGRPRIRTYTNQPDRFNVTLMGPNITANKAGENQIGATGRINLAIEISDEEIQVAEGEYNVNFTLILEECGPWFPNIGLLGLTDSGNVCNVLLTFTYLEDTSGEIATVVEEED